MGLKWAIAIIALAAAPLFADDVYLRGGGQITGVIIEQTDESVTVDIGGASISARMSSVVRIEESTSPLQEYRARAEAIPDGDAEAWRELARWATGRTLSSEGLEAYEQVVAILPDDQEANKALGLVQVDGKWITEEENYRARGYVYFEGAWMTPAEQQRIVSDRRARKQADRKANDAKIQEIEAEQKAEKDNAEAKRKEEERRRNPVSWGWGYGPRYWPHPARGQ